MSQLLHEQNIEKAHKWIDEKKMPVKQGKMRQKYHFMAEAGWLNDPNGLIFFRGKYHLFYQYNPYDAYWGSMHWGHAVSNDMVHWEYLPLALAPSEHYDNHKEGGCFSGSAIEHEDKLYLFYTGTTNYGDGFVQTQCMAYSEDGIHFTKYENNPIIKAPKEYDEANFRDPKVWKHGEYFYMVCGAKKDELAQALLFRSSNLTDWEFFNVLAESRGELGYMWECPDFYPIGDKHVLMFSPMGVHERTTVYLVGDMNYETGKFTYSVTGEIDWGFDYYAPQSFLDDKGRRVIVAWANAWDWMPWWKDWGPTFKEGWCGSFALPREVRLCEDNMLQFFPVTELETLRENEMNVTDVVVRETPYEIPLSNGNIYEMKLEIDLEQSNAERFSLILRADAKNKTVIEFDLKYQMMSFDRNMSDGWSTGKTKSPLLLEDKRKLSIHVFADQSSIEVFTDNYKTNHSCNVFAKNNQDKNYIAADNGKIFISHLSTWELLLPEFCR